jgi:Protein of unknown function (DUF4256)
MPNHDTLLATLKARFEKHMHRHKDVKWSDVQARLAKNPEALESLHQMEETGGEPDVVTLGGKGEITFVDCAGQSPKGRRSLCFDDLALRSRKENKPKNSAWTVAKEMGVLLLTEDEYRTLQTLGEFDTTTSSWIQTPEAIRKLGGALFCDRRYNTVFTYHNGAESYYAARGFRASLTV